jgi:hypothetical protein
LRELARFRENCRRFAARCVSREDDGKKGRPEILSATGETIAAPKRPTAKSKLTNGATLPGVDGRSCWVRRLRDLIDLHLRDLGGEDHVSEAERSIVRRAATLTVELERLELRFAKDGKASSHDLHLYQRTAGNLRRLLESIGLERRNCEAPVDLRRYLDLKANSKDSDGGKQ